MKLPLIPFRTLPISICPLLESDIDPPLRKRSLLKAVALPKPDVPEIGCELFTTNPLVLSVRSPLIAKKHPIPFSETTPSLRQLIVLFVAVTEEPEMISTFVAPVAGRVL